MNRFATFSAALLLAAATAAPVLAGPAVITLNPAIAKQVRIGKIMPQVKLPTPLPRPSVCPDLSVLTSQRQQADGTIRVTVKVVNRSGADYVTAPNQQMLVIRGREGGHSATVRFGNVNRGDEVIWRDVFHPFEFPASYTARITFDPDIRLDGNPQNDDCNAADNVASLTTLR